MASSFSEACLFQAIYPPGVCFSERAIVNSKAIVVRDISRRWGFDDRLTSHGDDGSQDDDSEATETESRPRLLSLPLEIRLCIYHWLLLMNPVRHADLGPGYPVPVHTRYILRTVRDENRAEKVEDADPEAEACSPEAREHRGEHRESELLLSPDRPFAGLPTGLLRSCRQIYFEARLVPFTANESVFINWFSSGLSTAAAVTKAQRPWQRDAVRYVRLEVLARDLSDPTALQQWAELCGRGSGWAAGLRGIRLTIMGLDGDGAGAESHHDGDGDEEGTTTTTTEGDDDDDDDDYNYESGLVSATMTTVRGWVEVAGLASMSSLERMEIEVQAPTWGSRQKLAWCRMVQNVLGAMGSGVQVQVSCVEKRVR
ncbi:hypothetical protein PT974_06314 [Cladobotryum mycophilum]|uniref:Uncharacterized protein n=1 Tax=Cladobotryum mycophilum TaxID=491253 RepID=A0ABR0SL40_9HYPO